MSSLSRTSPNFRFSRTDHPFKLVEFSHHLLKLFDFQAFQRFSVSDVSNVKPGFPPINRLFCLINHPACFFPAFRAALLSLYLELGPLSLYLDLFRSTGPSSFDWSVDLLRAHSIAPSIHFELIRFLYRSISIFELFFCHFKRILELARKLVFASSLPGNLLGCLRISNFVNFL